VLGLGTWAPSRIRNNNGGALPWKSHFTFSRSVEHYLNTIQRVPDSGCASCLARSRWVGLGRSALAVGHTDEAAGTSCTGTVFLVWVTGPVVVVVPPLMSRVLGFCSPTGGFGPWLILPWPTAAAAPV
jgi:hypothetical protein